jgi:hypothetical protein
MLRFWTTASVIAGSLLVPFDSIAAPIFYGGVGRGSGTNGGDLITIDQVADLDRPSALVRICPV